MPENKTYCAHTIEACAQICEAMDNRRTINIDILQRAAAAIRNLADTAPVADATLPDNECDTMPYVIVYYPSSGRTNTYRFSTRQDAVDRITALRASGARFKAYKIQQVTPEDF